MKEQNSLQYKQNIEALDNNASHVQLIDKIPNGSCVLDVGCACGDLGAYLFNHKDCVMYGLEYDRASITVAERTGAYRYIEQVDLNSFSTLPEAISAPFDRIVFGDVLEHLYDPQDVLQRFIPFLAKEGRVVISIPNITHASIVAQMLANKFEYMDYGILDKTHIRFFNSGTIASLLSKLGFRILSADLAPQNWSIL